MAAPEAEEREPSSWEELLRKMLPEGAPLPDEDQLDYSISVDFIGPSPFFTPPVNPVIPRARFTTFPKEAPSLTPRNTAWLKSCSSSDTTNSENKRLSASSVASDDATYEISNNGDAEAAGDHCDRDNSSGSLEGGREMKRGVCSLSTGDKRREYCRKCVLKAMGSMPEGRKCVGCIGTAINEANRDRLGKGSRLLARLCSRLELKNIMKVERECKANQVRAEQEGEKPDRIISSKLDVGGKLQTAASGGKTRVYMNGREITKVELRVLKLAKVQCPRDTHFWLYDDGSYEEEGQTNIKGYIWKRQASIRALCSLFSLPVPPECAPCTKEEPASFSARLFPEFSEQHRVQKLLLLGIEGSGASTIFKQAKFIYTNKLTTEELENIKLIIQRNTYRYLSILLEGREHFEEEALLKKECAGQAVETPIPGETECDGSRQCIYSVNQKISNFSDWFLDLTATGDINTFFPAAAREYAPVIEEVWKDPAIQETYKRREELKILPNVAKYFLDRVIEISSNEYEPSEKDILFAEGVIPSNGLASIEFSFGDHSAVSEMYNQLSESQQPLTKYQLIQLSSKGLYNGCKWLEMFEGMRAIVFCVSLSDYNQSWTNTAGLQQNKMLACRDFFESVARHSCFEGTPFLLLLTKYDLLEDKIDQVPITVCEWFRDFNPLKTHSKSLPLAHQAFYYIAVKFKELYTSITGRKLYVRQVQAHEQSSVDEAFRYVREMLDWEEQKNGDVYASSDEDSDSVPGAEASSSPLS
ncbi:UNVERIFIED_CONTAM: Extra-large guanine nucleotide-binding protein 3 [Sesamum latifolium]|uniref:Extra-large guanine nucleotide-binding protein 3 n=1 Tax=Sesamum latifolium TaxID=2727402 RepID=A0AAW2UE33_9LAMI